LVPLVCCLLPAGCTTQSPPASVSAEAVRAADQLLDGMRQRLLLMHDVARWKWNHHQAIADPEREAAFLAAMEPKGAPHGLDPKVVRTFFSSQIEAARRIQEENFRRWQQAGQGPFAGVPDLHTVLRPRIDAVSDSLLASLARVRAIPRADEAVCARAPHLLVGDGITDQIRQAALALWAAPGGAGKTAPLTARTDPD
jgi:chorismate mutase